MYAIGSRMKLPDGVEVELVESTDPRIGKEPSWSVTNCKDKGVECNAESWEAVTRKGTERKVEWWLYWVKARPIAAKPAILTSDKAARKEMPIARGLFDYFPKACAYVSHVSFKANEQHNPGEPMHWAREKSTDHADCIARHLIERGGVDDDGLRHSGKLAWRALAQLELELEAAE
jgi:hypothetical protein